MKKLIGNALLAFGLLVQQSFGAVSITPASGGTALSADTAADAPGVAWSTLGAIVIIEGSGNGNRDNFNAGTGVTLVLKAPAGFEFNTAVTPSIGATGGDITSTAIAVTDSTTLTITLDVSSELNRDTLTIGAGLEVRPTSATPLASGIIYRPSVDGGTAVIENVATSANADGSGGTSFGNLVEVGGAPVGMTILTQPSDTAVAGVAFAQQPVVELRDQFDNISTGNNTAMVTAVGSAALTGTTTVTVVNGVATFADLAAVSAGTITIDFTSDSLPTVTSSEIVVAPAPPQPAALVVTTEPSSSATAGAAFTQQPVVSIYDQYGDPFTADSATIVTATRLGGEGTLQGTLTAQAVDGVVMFTDLFHTVANDITIEFTATGLSNAVSQTVTVTAAVADSLAFTTQPGSALAGIPFGTQPVIATQDQFGNASTVGLAANVDVTVALTTGTGPLTGTTTLDIGTAAGNGVVTFTDLAIGTADANNQLTATATDLASASSDIFAVAPVVASRLTISTQPSSTAVAGVSFDQQPVIRIEDESGNLVVDDNTTTVTASIGTGTAALQGTVQATAVGGIVTFADLSYNTAETITLTFNAIGLTGATSDSIVVDAAAASQLVFTTQPAGGYAGAAFLTQPVVQARDEFGNNSSVGLPAALNVTLTLTAGSGSLTGTTTADIGTDAGDGVVTFGDVGVTDAGLAKQLTATASGLTDATSALFNIGGVTAPTVTVSADTAISGFTTVAGITYYESLSGDVGVGTIVLDAPAGFEFDTGGAAPTVRIQKISGEGNVGNIQGAGVFSGGANNAVWPVTSVTTTQITFTVTSASSGVTDSLTWQNVRVRVTSSDTSVTGTITKSGTSAMAAVVDGATVFANLNVAPGSVHHLVIETQPSAVANAGIQFAQQPVIRLEDQFNQVVTNDSSSTVNAVISQGNDSLQGTVAVTAVNGYATFTDLSYNVAETITIDFSTGALPAVTSDEIVVGAGTADRIVFSVQPAAAVAGFPFGIQPVVKTQDAFGNDSVLGLPATLDVTAALTAGSGALSGTTTVDIGTDAGNGFATFTDLSIDLPGTDKQLTVSGDSLIAAVSDTFVVTTADHLEYVDGDGQTGTVGTALAIDPTVLVVDTNGAPVEGVLVTFSVQSGDGSVGSATAISDASGLASTSFILGPTVGVSNNVLLASALLPGNPASITFYASAVNAAAAQLGIETQPSATAVAGEVFAQQPVVRIEDEFGNLVGDDNTTVVTVAVGTGTGTLQGTLQATAVNGLATFTDLSHNVAGTINLAFSAIDLIGITSSDIEITPAAVSQLGFTTQPGNARTDSLLDPQPVVATQDQFGNDSTVGLVATLPVTVALTSGSGELLGTTTFDIGTDAGNGSVTFTNLQVTTGGIDKQLTASASGLPDAVSELFRIGGVDPATIPIVPADGTFVSVTGPGYYELASGDVSVGTVTLSAPAGYQFNTASPVTVVVTRIGGNGNPDQNINEAQNGNGTDYVATVTPTEITFTVTSPSLNGVTCSLTWEGIQVGVAVGVPDAESHIVHTGTSTLAAVVNGVTSFGAIVGDPRPVILVIDTQPSASAVAGVPFAQQPVVRVEDQFGNLWTNSSVNVTASVATGTGVLQGTVTVASVDGIATFSGLSYNVAETITLAFDGNLLVGDSSLNIVVSPAAATVLVFSTEPGNGVVGLPLSVQPVVKTVDAFGNLSTVDLPTSLPVSLALTSGSGALIGTTVIDIGTSAGNGTATFVDVGGDTAGAGKQITASAAGLTSAISATFDVAKANQTITFNPLADKTIDSPAFTVSATASSGLPVTFTIVSGPASIIGNTITLDGVTGTVTVRAEQAGDVNFNAAAPVEQSFDVLETTKQAQTITFTTLTNVVYGAGPITLEATASSGLPVTFTLLSGPVTLSNNVLTITGVGTVEVRASQAGDDDFQAAPSVDQTFEITPAALVVTADNKSKFVGEVNPALTGSVTGVQYDDNISANYETTATTGSGAGTYPITFTLSDPDGKLVNYNVTTNNGTLTVSVLTVPVILTHPQSQTVLQGSNVTFTVVATGGLLEYQWRHNGADIAGATGSSYTINPVTVVNAGTYDVVVSNTSGGVASLGAELAITAIPGDFDGNGHPEVLFQNAVGQLAVWYMSGTSFMSSSLLREGATPTGWEVVGVGDFNGDGYSDILFQHDNGVLAVWRMNGSTFLGATVLRDGLPATPGWRVVGVGDFNGDTKPDIVFQNGGGKVALWRMNGLDFIGANLLRGGQSVGEGSSVAGVCDLNGDGSQDILVRNVNGQLSLWAMDGVNFSTEVALRSGPAESTGWRIVGLADFTGDGKIDILWQNAIGQIAVWTMDGTTFVSSAFLRDGAAATWSVVGPK